MRLVVGVGMRVGMEVGMGGGVEMGVLFVWRSVEDALLFRAVVIAAPSPLGVFGTLSHPHPLTDLMLLIGGFSLEKKKTKMAHVFFFWSCCRVRHTASCVQMNCCVLKLVYHFCHFSVSPY